MEYFDFEQFGAKSAYTIAGRTAAEIEDEPTNVPLMLNEYGAMIWDILHVFSENVCSTMESYLTMVIICKLQHV